MNRFNSNKSALRLEVLEDRRVLSTLFEGVQGSFSSAPTGVTLPQPTTCAVSEPPALDDGDLVIDPAYAHHLKGILQSEPISPSQNHNLLQAPMQDRWLCSSIGNGKNRRGQSDKRKRNGLQRRRRNVRQCRRQQSPNGRLVRGSRRIVLQRGRQSTNRDRFQRGQRLVRGCERPSLAKRRDRGRQRSGNGATTAPSSPDLVEAVDAVFSQAGISPRCRSR